MGHTKYAIIVVQKTPPPRFSLNRVRRDKKEDYTTSTFSLLLLLLLQHSSKDEKTTALRQYPMSMTQEVRGQPPKLAFLRKKGPLPPLSTTTVYNYYPSFELKILRNER